jgi:hypothetical protein
MLVRCNGIIIHYVTGGTNIVVQQSHTRDTTNTARWLEPQPRHHMRMMSVTMARQLAQ